MKEKIESLTVGAIETNCWFYPLSEVPALNNMRPCVVIDPGDEAERIISMLKKLQWIPAFIFLTHGHLDHLAALPDLLASFSKNFDGPLPKTGIHREDARYLGENSYAVHRESFTAAGGNPAFVDALWKPMPEGGILFEEGDRAGPFTILHIPGHTRGSVGFYDEKAGVLFSGDTLFRGDWGRTDLPGGNEDEIRRSLRRLLSMKGDIAVYPGHGPATTIKDEAALLS